MNNETTFISLAGDGKIRAIDTGYDRVVFQSPKGTFFLFLVKPLEVGQAIRITDPSQVGTAARKGAELRYRRIEGDPANFTTDEARRIYCLLVDEGIALPVDELYASRAARSEM